MLSITACVVCLIFWGKDSVGSLEEVLCGFMKGKGCAVPHWSAAVSPGFVPRVKGADHVL